MTRARDVADTQDNTGGAVAPFLAGKNKIINGDFAINQRGFTSTTTSASYCFDRFRCVYTGGTTTYSAQTFTPGAAPVVGYEGTNFIRLASSGQSASNHLARLEQIIENVRTLAGQTATISFWAKASTGTPFVGVTLEQYFGSGGSADTTTVIPRQAITSNWARYSFTTTVPSVSGKTIGTNSSLYVELYISAGSGLSVYSDVGLQNVTIDIWGVQVEAGNVATPFTTATGTLAGELAACQRYCLVYDSSSNNFYGFGNGHYYSTTQVYALEWFPVEMRVAPSVTFSTASAFCTFSSGTQRTATGISSDVITTKNAGVIATTASATAGNGAWIAANGSTSAKITWSAEL